MLFGFSILKRKSQSLIQQSSNEAMKDRLEREKERILEKLLNSNETDFKLMLLNSVKNR